MNKQSSTETVTDNIQETMNKLAELFLQHLYLADSETQSSKIEQLFIIYRASLGNVAEDSDDLLEIPKTVCSAVGAAALLNLLGKVACESERKEQKED